MPEENDKKTTDADASSPAPKPNRRKVRKKLLLRRIIIIVIIALVIAGGAFLVYLFIRQTEGAMESKLETYAREIYEKELKDRDSTSYTINLNYLDRNGYDISVFESKNCDKAGTYVVINVGDNKDIATITPQLNCGEATE